jgi:hypothetical protein
VRSATQPSRDRVLIVTSPSRESGHASLIDDFVGAG